MEPKKVKKIKKQTVMGETKGPRQKN